MHCPSLSELPPPPSGAPGWPWTEQSEPLAERMPDGSEWPKISIVTPSFNQGQFIEETIRSVLLQNYPNLEYIVIDGGSTDETVAILKKYSDWISFWCSEKDNGQADAINKGLRHASGFIRGYLNSDDLLLPHALHRVAQALPSCQRQATLVLGNCEMGADLNEPAWTWSPELPHNFMEAVNRDGLCPQPATFWTQPAAEPFHQFVDRLGFCMDYEFWCHLIKSGYYTIKINESLAFYRHHPNAKGATISDVMWAELAGLPLLEMPRLKSFNEKLQLASLSRRRLRHYLRLEIESIFCAEGRKEAVNQLIHACRYDVGLIFERPTLGLMRKLLFLRS